MALPLNARPRQQLIVLVGIAALAIAAWLWLQRQRDDSAAGALDDALLGEPDLYVELATVTRYEPSGAIEYLLRAEVVRRFESEGITRMTAPQLQVLNRDAPPWQVKSKTGYISEGSDPAGPGDRIFLRGEVRLLQQMADGRFVDVTGETLSYFPARRYAETDQSVTIDTEVGRTRAGGLNADLGAGTLGLSSSAQQRIHTIILPDQFK